MRLSKEERAELKKLAKSAKLQEDMRRLSRQRHNPFVVDGQVDIDRFLVFLTEYNYFINHARRPFRRIKDEKMRL